ncbi:MAG: triphosphoribosyl-dephospho-CoA synthase [Fuerstiella sp.]|mgnify:CR=1 FL=1
MTEWTSQLHKWIRLCCVAEVSAAKPGNVSFSQCFIDVAAEDFLRSADAIAPVISQVNKCGIGETIFLAVQATQAAVHSNTNLGIVLLLTPMVAVSASHSLADGIEDVLRTLTVDDAVWVYKAIGLAAPGGLGKSASQDVFDVPTMDLRACMQLAADRDLIAAQYTNGFVDVLQTGCRLLQQSGDWRKLADFRLAWLALNLMAEFGDSLIQRKCGDEMNRLVSTKARHVLECGWPFTAGTQAIYDEFDSFLRADGNRRNPGTTADMIAAILFASLREGICTYDESGNTLMFSAD